MDEMRIITPFMKTIVSKLIKRAIKKSTGHEIDVQLNNFRATSIDGNVKLSMSVDATIDKDVLLKLLNM